MRSDSACPRGRGHGARGFSRLIWLAGLPARISRHVCAAFALFDRSLIYAPHSEYVPRGLRPLAAVCALAAWLACCGSRRADAAGGLGSASPRRTRRARASAGCSSPRQPPPRPAPRCSAIDGRTATPPLPRPTSPIRYARPLSNPPRSTARPPRPRRRRRVPMGKSRPPNTPRRSTTEAYAGRSPRRRRLSRLQPRRPRLSRQPRRWRRRPTPLPAHARGNSDLAERRPAARAAVVGVVERVRWRITVRVASRRCCRRCCRSSSRCPRPAPGWPSSSALFLACMWLLRRRRTEADRRAAERGVRRARPGAAHAAELRPAPARRQQAGAGGDDAPTAPSRWPR